MNILIMTNTYKPLVGGLEKSIELFAGEYRRKNHRVVIAVPEYPDMKPEEDVVRIPAVQNFNGTDFSLQLPIPGMLDEKLKDFRPDIIHSQHPFLVGDTALRLASKFNVPLVFTHHTLYEENVHYMPGEKEALKRFIVELSTGYANLADAVFAPSESVMNLIKQRGVETITHVVPTGLYVKNYARGAGKTFRKKLKIPSGAFVAGYVGRLAPEKNLGFLSQAVIGYLKQNPKAHFLVAGQGESEQQIIDSFAQAGLSEQLHMAGILKNKDLIDAYHALDVFVFASQSETQGMVLNEAMACKVPVVGVDAPGVREVIKDKVNGCLLTHENVEEFVSALQWIEQLPGSKLEKIKAACLRSSENFAMELCAQKALDVYAALCIQGFSRKSIEQGYWESKWRLMQAQWGLFKNLTKAAGALIGITESEAAIARV